MLPLLLLLLAGFLAGEIAARLILPRPLPWRQPQLRFQTDPDLIFALVPNQTAFSADKRVQINQRGLRGSYVSEAHAHGQRRILVLGDSVAFGFGVADADVLGNRTIVHLAQQGIDAEVINGAVPCYNFVQSVSFLQRECSRYAPDWVIDVISWNDFGDKSSVRVSKDGHLLSEGADSGGGWVHSESAYIVRNILKRSRLLYAVHRPFSGERTTERQRREDVLAGHSNVQTEEGWRQFNQAAASLARLSKECGFRTLLVTLPFRAALSGSYPASDYPKRVHDIARAHRLAVVDLEAEFRRASSDPGSLFLPYDQEHLNAVGHELVAQALASFLIHRQDDHQT
jgi:lysophospholipase L1-like esterase